MANIKTSAAELIGKTRLLWVMNFYENKKINVFRF